MERDKTADMSHASKPSLWLVTYRGKDGKQQVMELAAADRAEAFRLLQEQGISAIKVEESKGRRKSEGARKPRQLSGSLAVIKWLVAISILVAVAFAVWFVFLADSNDKNTDTVEKGRGLIKETPPVKSVKVEYQKPEKTGDKLKDALAEVSAAEGALTIKAAPKIKIPQGYTNRTFTTGVEQLMSWVFSVEVGDMPMPIPPIGEEDREQLAIILVSKNEIKEGDSEMTAFCKEQVDFAKGEMREFIKQGGDPDEFLQYYFNQLRHAFEFRNEAQQQYDDMLAESPELADKFANEVNKLFDEKGIKHILTAKDEQEAEEKEKNE